jgi:phosphatidylglycerol---prolipoprotein diacylglyceryl transferase
MLVHPQFDPVAFSLGPLKVHWYGLMYLLAFLQLWWLGRKRLAARPELGMTEKGLDDLLFYGVLGVVLGGRLGQVLFYEPEYYLQNPAEILAVWKGGMSFHGGFLGVLTAVAWWARTHQASWLSSLPWCRWGWLSAASATLSTASSGAAWPTLSCRGP